MAWHNIERTRRKAANGTTLYIGYGCRTTWRIWRDKTSLLWHASGNAAERYYVRTTLTQISAAIAAGERV